MVEILVRRVNRSGGKMELIDHTNPQWLNRKTEANGAETYSKDLVKYQIPHWENLLGDKDLISTCPLLYTIGIKGNYNVTIQYLHKYPYTDAIGYANKLQKAVNTKEIIYITAYKEYEKLLRFMGLKAVYIPMAIDVAYISSHRQPKAGHDGIIYFGQVRRDKKDIHFNIKQACKRLHIPFATITYDKLNGKTPVTQEEALKFISTFKYGVGVGRCAQEMMALGVKVMIAGIKVGGLITNEQEYQKQLATNMNGRVWTYSNKIDTCLVDRALATGRPQDITTINHADIVFKAYPEVFDGN